MEVYRTEEEQIEALKKYFSQYGTRTLLVVVMGIAIFFGYQAWQQSQKKARESASLYYNQLVDAIESGAISSDQGQKQFDETFAKLLKEYPETIYASYASLHKAKQEVAKQQYDKAVLSLQWVIDAAVNPAIKALANLRLARVEFARGNLDKAMALLQNDPGPFSAEYAEMKGDLFFEKNEPEKALVEYKKAQAMVSESAGYTNKLLGIKIESLTTGDSIKLHPAISQEDAENTK